MASPEEASRCYISLSHITCHITSPDVTSHSVIFPSLQEASRMRNALKDEKFRKLLAEYAEEISDPENKMVCGCVGVWEGI